MTVSADEPAPTPQDPSPSHLYDHRLSVKARTALDDRQTTSSSPPLAALEPQSSVKIEVDESLFSDTPEHTMETATASTDIDIRKYDGNSTIDNSNTLVLPEGVVLPPSVTPDLLSGRVRNLIFQLPPSQMNDVLTEYDEAVRSKTTHIRNHQSYLFGVVKRYISMQEKARDGDFGANPMGADLTEKVKERLKKLVDSNYCTQAELDGKVMSKMRLLPERDALSSIEELSAVPRAQIRNFGSYFMGILNRYMRGEKLPPHLNKNRQQHERRNYEQDDRNSLGSRSDDKYYSTRDFEHRVRSPGDDRYRYDDSPSYNRRRDGYRRDHGQDRHREGRRERERSRDNEERYSSDRYNGDRYSDGRYSGSRNRRYDDRGSPNRNEYSNRRTDRDSYRDARRPTPYREENMFTTNLNTSENPSTFNFSQPGSQQNPTVGIPPPPPPPPHLQQPPPQHFMNQPQPHQIMQSQGGQPQHIVPQQQFLAQPMNNSVQQIGMAPLPMFAQPPPSAAPPPGSFTNMQQPPTIQFMQTLPSNAFVQQPNLQGQQQSMYQNHNVITAPPAPQNSWQMQAPPDIMNLADQAASAVQALAAQPMQSQIQSNPHPVGMPHQNAQAFNNWTQSTNPMHSIEVEKVTVKDLPMMVQYALKVCI
uniref:Heterogeneous nuclear ribonucleoprotein Q acidic domain-containing protein n=1 Tax=Ditylum brightwellii TaxID=49249 RepID=A0A7S4QK27_9STRA|mmetsp:Transcript_11179/g.16439  ORF Transcript_11179/g.16439 Transcript_11179/m.16439 type:complete len:646 (+) Transcript_11179:290-2227(+)